MEEISSASAPYEAESSKATFCSSEIAAKLKNVSLASKVESISHDSPKSLRCDESLSRAASQVLWSTGTFAVPIPNGFYAVIPDRRLKELFVTIPSPEELYNLGITGLREEIILVDAEKDRKLSMLKQLSTALVKGQNFNQASVIKKLAGLVSDFYKRPSSDLSPAKGFPDEIFHPENKCIQLLGQLRHGSCRPRAILFKVLADCVGLETRLVAGLPEDGTIEHTDSYKHMSVVTVLNSVELLVDLMRFPGQLIPFSAKAVCISHISAPGESDSAENDSCDSPFEPTSPLCGFPDGEAYDQDENLQSFFPRRTEASSYVASPRRHTMAAVLTEKIFSEPSIANAFPRRSRRKEIAEQRTASSSPEHPLFRAWGRSMLSGGRQPLDSLAASRSDGASTSGTRRTRRRSISVTPEIGDDVVRAVRRMNESLKQNRRSRDKGGEVSSPYSNQKDDDFDSATDELHFHSSNHDELSEYDRSRNQFSNHDQKAVSLPSSPHHFRRGSSDGRAASSSLRTGIFYSAFNKLLKSSSFLNKPLFSFEEWNIDFSELSVGTRVGIGFFGEVFRGIWNGTDVAIKVFLEQDLTTENVEDFCNEISILSRLRHPNVILFLGACMRPPHLSMVTEYMEMGSLYYLIHISGQKKKISWRKRIKILQDICRGLMCIHRMKIIHRDLKSANCLVDKHWTVKICDFGLSRIMSDGPLRDNSSAGTPEWMAPELIRNEPFTEKCDIFSLGVIMWELCTLSRPWEGITPVQVVYAVANEGTRLEIPEGPLGKLIADCWAEPEVRPSCPEILSRLLDCEYTIC